MEREEMEIISNTNWFLQSLCSSTLPIGKNKWESKNRYGGNGETNAAKKKTRKEKTKLTLFSFLSVSVSLSLFFVSFFFLLNLN